MLLYYEVPADLLVQPERALLPDAQARPGQVLDAFELAENELAGPVRVHHLRLARNRRHRYGRLSVRGWNVPHARLRVKLPRQRKLDLRPWRRFSGTWRARHLCRILSRLENWKSCRFLIPRLFLCSSRLCASWIEVSRKCVSREGLVA